MIASIVSESLPEIRALCKRQRVHRMSVFRSATTEDFSPESSDVDFLVSFFDSNTPSITDRYFNLVESLEKALHRPVDLVTEKSIRNPYFREAVEKSKVLIYDATD